ncbi:bifunctional phosphoribosyl-AMP cyclohydrolase/phosphoribosyl-ATP diphosphatase HisIE [Alteromonas oceanisediminis]|uniref:bifunctional phosphoribosyl-AMP cyclohydrolase/phosphoribosyl-ATP diphosphatase HisIE n=1 Tax=Alteromonas oceanisediminis TaxID=2836180 RepID=UPI001BDA2B5D|nr:bifunctional phosphoribosyl-AMP cyclohydrolase/phosphoribosyl-ATP diphosphatase HisIE [Alteromonas oceanisediminis]MBT0587485.1 bifunctional phosphoribosyl-AMP cyclohydrolase/phosphoribosyl-ATP diphosphatase HisIE [Alteromonas oceanisediminis]
MAFTVTHDTLANLAWDKMNGLLPATVQDAFSGKVLMQGFMNTDAVRETLSSGRVTFFSRSKQRLWTKGESSQHYLNLIDISADCDSDSLLVLAQPQGPTCHTGTESCWSQSPPPAVTFIADLERLLAARKGADPDSSYTASLYAKGIKRIAQKVGEEGVETALAATVQDIDELKNESADLLYHLLVLLQASNIGLEDVVGVLKQRHGQSSRHSD